MVAEVQERQWSRGVLHLGAVMHSSPACPWSRARSMTLVLAGLVEARNSYLPGPAVHAGAGCCGPLPPPPPVRFHCQHLPEAESSRGVGSAPGQQEQPGCMAGERGLQHLAFALRPAGRRRLTVPWEADRLEEEGGERSLL